MSETKLLRCPFCGGEARLKKGMCELDNYVMCLKCRCSTKLHSTKERAIKVWNTRKPMQNIVERLEEYNDEATQLGVGGMLADMLEIVKEEGGIK